MMDARPFTNSCWRMCLAAGLLFVALSAQAYKPSYAMDAFFAPGSAVVTRKDQLRLEEFACRLKHRSHDFVIAVGHTDNTERAAK